jgi:hypothetical protein
MRTHRPPPRRSARSVPPWFLVLAFWVAATSASADPGTPPVAPTRSVHGIDLPAYMHVAAWDTHLRLAGARVIDHHYLPFQVVALYVGADSPDGERLAAGLARCRLRIHWLGSGLDAAGATAWWQAAFARAVPEATARLRLEAVLSRITARIGAPARGAVTVVDYDPDAGLSIATDDQPAMRLAGLEVARAVLGVWLGDQASRRELMGESAPASQ